MHINVKRFEEVPYNEKETDKHRCPFFSNLMMVGLYILQGTFIVKSDHYRQGGND